MRRGTDQGPSSRGKRAALLSVAAIGWGLALAAAVHIELEGAAAGSGRLAVYVLMAVCLGTAGVLVGVAVEKRCGVRGRVAGAGVLFVAVVVAASALAEQVLGARAARSIGIVPVLVALPSVVTVAAGVMAAKR